MPSPNAALPAHVWEITVQVENGDWHYTRTPKTTFDEAVDQAVWFKSNFKHGKLISIQNVDPEERPRPPRIPGTLSIFHENIEDENIDTSDIPEAGEEFFQKAKLIEPQNDNPFHPESPEGRAWEEGGRSSIEE